MLVAQTTGGSGADLTQIATVVSQIGLSAIFLWLWWTERKERQELQQTLLDLMKQALPALAESTDTLQQVQSALTTQVELARPDPRRGDMAIRRIELIADELATTMRSTRRRKEDYEEGYKDEEPL